MGLFDRLKNAGNVLTEPSQFSNEELVNQAEMGRDPREQMQGEGLLKLFRAGTELLPDKEDSGIEVGKTSSGEPIRFDPSGFIGGVKNIGKELGAAANMAREVAPAAQEAMKVAGWQRVASPEHGDILKNVFTGIGDSAKSEQLAEGLKKLGYENKMNPQFGNTLTQAPQSLESLDKVISQTPSAIKDVGTVSVKPTAQEIWEAKLKQKYSKKQ